MICLTSGCGQLVRESKANANSSRPVQRRGRGLRWPRQHAADGITNNLASGDLLKTLAVAHANENETDGMKNIALGDLL